LGSSSDCSMGSIIFFGFFIGVFCRSCPTIWNFAPPSAALHHKSMICQS